MLGRRRPPLAGGAWVFFGVGRRWSRSASQAVVGDGRRVFSFSGVRLAEWRSQATDVRRGRAVVGHPARLASVAPDLRPASQAEGSADDGLSPDGGGCGRFRSPGAVGGICCRRRDAVRGLAGPIPLSCSVWTLEISFPFVVLCCVLLFSLFSVCFFIFSFSSDSAMHFLPLEALCFRHFWVLPILVFLCDRQRREPIS